MANVTNTIIASEIFSTEFQKRLNANNSFLSATINANAMIEGGKVLHIPNASTGGTVTVDGTIDTGGALTEDFAQSDVTTTLQVARVAPFTVQDFDEAVTKQDVFMGQFNSSISKLVDTVADNIIYKIVADELDEAGTKDNSYTVSTTGANGVANGPNGSVRNILTLADIKKARKILDKTDVPQNGRYLLINPEMYGELTSDTAVAAMLSNTERGAQIFMSGALGMIEGFIVLMRSWTGTVSLNTALVPEISIKRASSENSAYMYTAIAFQSESVYTAVAPTKIWVNDMANYYGQVASAEQRFGAVIPRKDNKGVVIIAQAS